MSLSRTCQYRQYECTHQLEYQNSKFKKRVDEQTEIAVVNFAMQYPDYGHYRTSNALHQIGILLSGSGVRFIWLRHNLENFKKRFKVLEIKVAQEGVQ